MAAAFETTAASPSSPSAHPVRNPVWSRRLRRERRTMAAMIECYCHDHHGLAEQLCPECLGLMDYATFRLERCRFGEAKPTCAKCPVHCYQARRRQQVKEVMRYAGPKMLWQHPLLALSHLLDGFRRAEWPVASKTTLQGCRNS